VKPTSSFFDSTSENQVQMAERELAAFMRAVAEMFGSEQARLAAEDWLNEAELIDSPPRSTNREWRAVTVGGAARLASRLAIPPHRRRELALSADTKVSPIPSSNCFRRTLLV
jgi:hypothetical protein